MTELIKLLAFFKAVKAEAFVKFVFLIMRNGVRVCVARSWRGLKTLITPATIKIEALGWRFANER